MLDLSDQRLLFLRKLRAGLAARCRGGLVNFRRRRLEVAQILSLKLCAFKRSINRDQ